MNFDFDIVVKKYLRSYQHLNWQRKLHWNILIALVIDFHGIKRINDNHDDNNFVVWINDKKDVFERLNKNSNKTKSILELMLLCLLKFCMFSKNNFGFIWHEIFEMIVIFHSDVARNFGYVFVCIELYHFRTIIIHIKIFKNMF